jgi:hypothetical protein
MELLPPPVGLGMEVVHPLVGPLMQLVHPEAKRDLSTGR